MSAGRQGETLRCTSCRGRQHPLYDRWDEHVHSCLAETSVTAIQGASTSVEVAQNESAPAEEFRSFSGEHSHMRGEP